MTVKIIRQYSCDHPGCLETSMGRDDKWWFMKGVGHFCPRHKNRRCTKCGHHMRPQGVKIADQPGTKRYGGRGLCYMCLRGQVEITTVAEPNAKFIRRLAEQRLSGDDYLLVMDAFGIGDDTV